MKLKKLIPALVVAALMIPLAGCAAGGGSSASTKTTVNWWTWDEKQAASYKSCLPGFEKENPGVTIKISQYAVDAYFTKLTAGFVAGNAPDAFQNSVQFFDAYAKQHQLEPLDSYITSSKFNLDRFNVGVSAWKYTDGKQYGLPLDWAAPAFFYNKDMVEKAGLTDKDIQTMTWNPKDGGTFDTVAARLTTDVNGKHADEAGFDKDHVAVYGTGLLGSSDFLGQTTWGSFISTTGWRLGNKESWPTAFQYDKPVFAQTMEYMRGLSDRGIAPKFGEFTIGGTEQLGSGKVALLEDGSWTASSALQLPGVKIGVAPTVLGPDGTTRASLSNSNGNEIWAGSKNKEAAWKWISYMGTEGCQTKAALVSGSFFPSIPGAMKTFAASQKSKGVDLSVFENAAQKKEIYPASPYANGSDIGTTLTPMFESYMLHETNSEVFPKLYTAAKDIIAGKK